MVARYDGNAGWYDEAFARYGDLEREGSSAALVAGLLGPGEGWCLDVACGTGLHHRAVRATGRRVIGVDLSRDQLGIARGRADAVVRGDAARLPIASASFPAAVCTYLHTDIDDMRPVFREIHRVLQPGGRFVYVGVHPCFKGHFVDLTPANRRIIHPGYWDTGWDANALAKTGEMRRRVGARHVTLSELLSALLASGLRLVAVEEGDRSEPFVERLGFGAVRD